MVRILDKLKWLIGIMVMLGVIYAFVDDARWLIANAKDVPDIKRSVEKLSDLAEEATSFSIFLRNHLIAQGIDEKTAKKWSGFPIGRQFDSTGVLITDEPYLARDSLLVRGLLLMDDDSLRTDTLKELWRFKLDEEH